MTISSLKKNLCSTSLWVTERKISRSPQYGIPLHGHIKPHKHLQLLLEAENEANSIDLDVSVAINYPLVVFVIF